MTLKAQILERLETLLGQVSQDLSPPTPLNSCGACKSCCTAEVLTQHKVTDMEFALLAERVGAESSARFREYIERRCGADDQLLHPVCPYYQGGCSVYLFRPFSCRTFGHIREEGTRLPEGCVFQGKEKVTRKSDYYTAIPGSVAMRELWREFQLLVALPPEAGKTLVEIAELDGGIYINRADPLDRTVEHLARQRYEEAYAELSALDPATETPARTELWGLALTAVGRHQEALAKYRLLLETVPPRADFLYHAGCSAFMLGDMALAERLWQQSCQLTPSYGPSLGMLGYMANILHEWPQAVDYFTRALQADSSNPFYHLRLGEALRGVGDVPAALSHLRQARENPATHESAQSLMAEMAC